MVLEMNIAILGNFGKRPLAPGWKKETAFAALGGGEFDLSDAPASEGARLTVVAVLGAIKVRVAPGTRVTMQGFSFLDCQVFCGRSHAVNATSWSNASDGFIQPSVCRGRPLSSSATASSAR
jgi:hypothetical protein